MGHKQSCTKEMRKSFSDENFKELKEKLASSNNRDDLELILNPFLFSLGQSHTEFFGPKHEGFHFFRSHANLRNKNKMPLPQYFNPGLQFYSGQLKNRVRAVLNGSNAHLAGLFVGDIIQSSNGKPFKGYWGESGVKNLMIKRGKETLHLDVDIQSINLSQALLEAQKSSVDVFAVKGKRIGYIRLWTGTHPESSVHLKNTVKGFRSTTDAMILDLRDGYGGAWWHHLDAFFKDRNSFFISEAYDTDGKKHSMKPEQQANPDYYQKPLAVLINSGVRSGKEALAYQFKKTGRGKLVGTKTPGYFTIGQFLFADQNLDYVLYLCRKRLTLDGKKIEGVGIEPDLKVEHSITEGKDSQIEAAIHHLSTSLL